MWLAVLGKLYKCSGLPFRFQSCQNVKMIIRGIERAQLVRPRVPVYLCTQCRWVTQMYVRLYAF